jgi:hypothetical protein
MDLRGFKKVSGDIYMKPLYDTPREQLGTPTKIKDSHEVVACHCGACFETRHVKLKYAVEFGAGFTPQQTFYYVDGDDYIRATEKPYEFAMFDKLLICPACDYPAPYGFKSIDREVYDKLK